MIKPKTICLLAITLFLATTGQLLAGQEKNYLGIWNEMSTVKPFSRSFFSARVNDLTPEFLEKINAADPKPVHVVIGETCSDEDFAKVCTWPWIREMRIDSRELTDITPLAQLTELTSLKMFMMREPKQQRIDIGALNALKKLEKIEFYSTRVTNTDALAGLSELKDLSIYMSAFESLDFLEHTPAIERLNLQGSHTFEDYQPLLHLENLRELDITANTQAVDEKLKILEGLTTLEAFSMALCLRVTSLDFLRNCRGLKELNVKAAYALRDMSALAGFPQLEKLNLSSVPLRDISFLKANPKLKELDLRSTKVTDISVLAEARELVQLNLESTGITDFSPLLQLDGLPQLKLPEEMSAEEVAALKAKAFPPEEMKRLAPTGLTLVACDSDWKVVATLVVPDDKNTANIDLTLPDKMTEIQIFVIGTRERIFNPDGEAQQSNWEFYDELYQINTESSVIYRRSDNGDRWRIARIKKGVIQGLTDPSFGNVRPFKLTAELKKQIHEDIVADESTAILKLIMAAE